MFFDRADADSQFSGNHALLLAVDPKASENRSGPFRHRVQNILKDCNLLLRDQLRFDGRLVIHFTARTMDIDPIFFAADAASGCSPMYQKMIIGHFVQIGSRLRHRAGRLVQQFELNVLKDIFGLFRGCPPC